MKLRPFHPRLMHALTEDDPDHRVEFAEEGLWRLENNVDLKKHVIWSDEAKFHVSGSVIGHNFVYWRPVNPHEVIEYDHRSPGVMVLGGVSYDGLIGPFFLEGGVTGESYLNLLEHTVYPVLLEREDIDELWFQQDGAPPHYALIVRAWLDDHFPQRWIGRRGPVEWPARSSDLTPSDFFLWGYLKGQVYRHSIENAQQLTEFITRNFIACLWRCVVKPAIMSSSDSKRA